MNQTNVMSIVLRKVFVSGVLLACVFNDFDQTSFTETKQRRSDQIHDNDIATIPKADQNILNTLIKQPPR